MIACPSLPMGWRRIGGIIAPVRSLFAAGSRSIHQGRQKNRNGRRVIVGTSGDCSDGCCGCSNCETSPCPHCVRGTPDRLSLSSSGISISSPCYDIGGGSSGKVSSAPSLGTVRRTGDCAWELGFQCGIFSYLSYGNNSCSGSGVSVSNDFDSAIGKAKVWWNSSESKWNIAVYGSFFGNQVVWFHGKTSSDVCCNGSNVVVSNLLTSGDIGNPWTPPPGSGLPSGGTIIGSGGTVTVGTAKCGTYSCHACVLSVRFSGISTNLGCHESGTCLQNFEIGWGALEGPWTIPLNAVGSSKCTYRKEFDVAVGCDIALYSTVNGDCFDCAFEDVRNNNIYRAEVFASLTRGVAGPDDVRVSNVRLLISHEGGGRGTRQAGFESFNGNHDPTFALGEDIPNALDEDLGAGIGGTAVVELVEV